MERSKVFFLCWLTVAVLSCAALRISVHASTQEPAKLETGAYAIDPSHAAIVFNVNHFGFSQFYGRFNSIEGSLDFNADEPETSRLSVHIDPSSIDTGNPELDSQLVSAVMFDTEAYPDVTFVSTRVARTGETTGQITGDLTMRGVTQPVTLDVAFAGSGDNPLSGAKTMGFSATTTIKRSEWGLAEWLPIVGNEVTLTISAEFAERLDGAN